MTYHGDLIEQYCKGLGERFGGEICPEYHQLENACLLLKTGRLAAIFKTCFKVTPQFLEILKQDDIPDNLLTRLSDLENQEFMNEEDFIHCLETRIGKKQVEVHHRHIVKSGMYERRCFPIQFVGNIIKKHLRKYEHVYDAENLDAHSEAIAFLIAKQYLIPKNNWNENYTLPALVKYLEKTIPYRLREILQREQEFPERTCRNCAFLSSSKPYKCDSQTSSYHMQIRRPSDTACRDFEALQLSSIHDLDTFSSHHQLEIPTMRPRETKGDSGIFPATPHETQLFEFVLNDCLKVLTERYLLTTRGKRRIYHLQYVIFVRITQLRYEGVERQEAIKLVAHEVGKSVKQIKDRYLPEIRQFLQEKNVLSA